MSWFLPVLALLGICGAQASFKLEAFEDYSDFKDLMGILQKPRVLDRHKTNKVGSEPHLYAFQWKNCGSGSDPLQLKSLTLQPDPLHIPGNVSVAFKASVASTLASPIKMELELQKKVLFWVTIPCVDNIGSCSYDDVCQLIKTVKCPPEFKKYGIPCNCPIAQKSYNLPLTSVNVNIPSIPSWLESGDYQVQAKLTQNGHNIGCVHVQVSLK